MCGGISSQVMDFQTIKKSPELTLSRYFAYVLEEMHLFISNRRLKIKLSVYSLEAGWGNSAIWKMTILKKKWPPKNRFTKFILKIIKRFLQKSITFCTLLWNRCQGHMDYCYFSSLSPTPKCYSDHKAKCSQ